MPGVVDADSTFVADRRVSAKMAQHAVAPFTERLLVGFGDCVKPWHLRRVLEMPAVLRFNSELRPIPAHLVVQFLREVRVVAVQAITPDLQP